MRIGDGQDFRVGIGIEDRPFRAQQGAVAGQQPVPGAALGAGLVLVAGVPGVVGVEAGHLVHPHHQVHRLGLQVSAHPIGEAFVEPVIGQGLDRRQLKLHAVRQRAVVAPVDGIDAHPVSTAAGFGDHLHQVPLNAAEGEILEDAEGDLHASAPSAKARAHTRSGVSSA